MYTKEQIETALKEFERLGSVQATITLLGYPSSSSLYKWYERKLANKKNYHGSPQKPYNVEHRYINSASHALYIFTSGSGVLHTLNKNFTLNESDLFLTFSSKPYYIENRNNLQYIYISFIGLRSFGLFERLDISYKKTCLQRVFIHYQALDRGI